MDTVPLPWQAGLWGLVAGSALVIGAAIRYFVPLPAMVNSSVMAFGIGVLVSALAFDLMEEAFDAGGIAAVAGGFVFHAVIYAVTNAALARAGARSRKKSSGGAATSATLAIAAGSLLDGTPESAAIGISLLNGEGVALVTMLAICISNVPEGLSSSIGMKAAGKSAAYVFSNWVVSWWPAGSRPCLVISSSAAWGRSMLASRLPQQQVRSSSCGLTR